MKRIKICLMILTVLFFGGCVKYDLTMGVNTDKSMSISLIAAVQKDYYTDDGGKTKQSYEDLGFSVVDYEDDGYKGYRLIKKYDSIDLISSSDCSQVEITNLLSMDLDNLVLFKSSKTGNITTYVADFIYDLTVEESGNAEADYSEYTETMDFKYMITLPNNSKIISENADEKTNNGYTLTWHVNYGEAKDIDFVFSIDDSVVTDPTFEEETENVDDEKNEIVTEEKSDDNIPKDEATVNNNLSWKNIISTIVLVVVIVGVVMLKRKMKKRSTTIKQDKKYHSSPRQR